MIRRDQILNLMLTDSEIISAIERALKNPVIFKRDNLRERDANIQLDCMIRGCVGEYAITRWLNENGIFPEATHYRPAEENMDIDFLYKNKNIELKTSLIPDIDFAIETSIMKRDIKIIQRSPEIENVSGDIHLQIFFTQRRKAKDEWLLRQKIDPVIASAEDLFKALRAERYCHDTYFVAWIDKPALIAHIHSLPAGERTWTFPGSSRFFWNCKIQNAKPPSELITYLRPM